jgi:ribosomal protein S18 acetylase RimI-like enzyme
MTTAALQPVALQPHQLEDSGHVLGRAFFDDPMTIFIMPDEAKRMAALTWFMRTGVGYGLRYGDVYTTPERVEGNAVWLPPGATTITPLRMLVSGMLLAPLKFGFPAFGRLNSVMSLFEKMHKRDMADPHWYLFVLGVDPPRQGQGVGGALLQPVLARADSAGQPCYLETTKERNVPFYNKHGFEVVVEGTVEGENAFRYWTMRRPART